MRRCEQRMSWSGAREKLAHSVFQARSGTASPLSERPSHKHELPEAVTLAASPGLILDIANQTRTLIVCPWKEQTAFTRILSGIHQDSQPPQAHFTQFVGELPDVAHQDLKKLSVGFAARDLDAAIAGRHHVRG